jgi:hypothetical protein
VLAALRRLHLLKDPGAGGEGPAHLPRLCAEGALEGGLSVALDVLPDELFGALAAAAGGPARRLKVLDVLDRPGPQMVVSRGPGAEAETWEVPDVRALVERLNALAAGGGDPQARLVAVLGEWDDALQLWCLPRSAVKALLRERGFQPENLAELRGLATA